MSNEDYARAYNNITASVKAVGSYPAQIYSISELIRKKAKGNGHEFARYLYGQSGMLLGSAADAMVPGPIRIVQGLSGNLEEAYDAYREYAEGLFKEHAPRETVEAVTLVLFVQAALSATFGSEEGMDSDLYHVLRLHVGGVGTTVTTIMEALLSDAAEGNYGELN